MAEEKTALTDLARSSGLNIDPTVLDLLVELICLGVQPKDIAPYLRAVIARSAKFPTPLSQASTAFPAPSTAAGVPLSARQPTGQL
mmetsp:Transcript_27381/g.74056  ORF Transcript_27381/g.74056 Transcript_27381/m.74056 type:complete len:86 (+) Transcript_27381:39-296(+)|eukprot:1161645-Pelagomonas_calceolata.AAC.4